MGSLFLALSLLAAPAIAAPVTVAPPPAQGAVPLVGIAPALTATALRDELRARSQQRQEELAALARQRAELEKLAAEVAAARAALEAGQRAPSKDGKVAKKEERPASASGADPRAPAVASAPTSPEALAKTVKGMKADQAAALLVRLDRGLSVEVLRRMKPADAGAILDRMKGETAAELFAAMAAAKNVATHAGER